MKSISELYSFEKTMERSRLPAAHAIGREDWLRGARESAEPAEASVSGDAEATGRLPQRIPENPSGRSGKEDAGAFDSLACARLPADRAPGLCGVDVLPGCAGRAGFISKRESRRGAAPVKSA